MDVLFYLSLSSLSLWVIIFLLPWRPWLTVEAFRLGSEKKEVTDLSDVTVLIPARNEAEVIRHTLSRVVAQGGGVRIVLVNDNSTDETAGLASSLKYDHFTLIQSKPLPGEWSGKLWGLEQGREQVKTPYVLLLDADIEIDPSLLEKLKSKLLSENLDFVSLMAKPPLHSFWEKLLMPAFIYFFKLLYPFRLSNSNNKLIAAAAGGCILTKTHILEKIGGFAAIKDALIDDCTLARKVKSQGYRIWLGLTHAVRTVRPYKGLSEIWNMVARTAYTQLLYSPLLLLLCTLLMILAFLIPLVVLFYPSLVWFALGALALIYLTYLPTVLYYRAPFWSLLLLPLVGAMYLMMTWTSAVRYWRGEQVRWRGRVVYKT